jgi:hypothetical protein
LRKNQFIVNNIKRGGGGFKVLKGKKYKGVGGGGGVLKIKIWKKIKK